MPELSATFFASLLCKFLFCLLNWTISLFTSAINPFGVLVFYFSNCFICGYHPPLHSAAIFSLPPPPQSSVCILCRYCFPDPSYPPPPPSWVCILCGCCFDDPCPHPPAGCVFYVGVVLLTPHPPHPAGCVFY